LRKPVEKGGSLILEVIASYFGDRTKFHLKSSRSKGGACVYWSSNKEVLKRLLVHAEAYPILGKKKTDRSGLI
ncbi:hypothetical protein CLOM_g12208, partial [Closterium sp. NIES-68]